MLLSRLHNAENRAPLLRHADAAFGAKGLQSSRYFSLRKWHMEWLQLSQLVACTLRRNLGSNAGQLDCQSCIMVDVIPTCDCVATNDAPSLCEIMAVTRTPISGRQLGLARRSRAGLSSGPRPGQLFRHLFP